MHHLLHKLGYLGQPVLFGLYKSYVETLCTDSQDISMNKMKLIQCQLVVVVVVVGVVVIVVFVCLCG